jgi:hypothetical protein
MNEHARGAVNGVVFKDNLDARPEPRQNRQRGPLGLAPVLEELSPPSALEGRSADELASPASIAHVLEALDTAIALRSDIERPLKVRIGRLESDNSALKAELATAQATIARTEVLLTALKSIVPSKEGIKLRIAAEVEVRVAAEFKAHVDAQRAKRLDRHMERIAKRAEQKAANS